MQVIAQTSTGFIITANNAELQQVTGETKDFKIGDAFNVNPLLSTAATLETKVNDLKKAEKDLGNAQAAIAQIIAQIGG